MQWLAAIGMAKGEVLFFIIPDVRPSLVGFGVACLYVFIYIYHFPELINQVRIKCSIINLFWHIGQMNDLILL